MWVGPASYSPFPETLSSDELRVTVFLLEFVYLGKAQEPSWLPFLLAAQGPGHEIFAKTKM